MSLLLSSQIFPVNGNPAQSSFYTQHSKVNVLLQPETKIKIIYFSTEIVKKKNKMEPIYMTLRSRVVPLRSTPKRKCTRAQKSKKADDEHDVVLIFHSHDPREIVDLTQISEQQDAEQERQIGDTSSDSIILEDDVENFDMLEELSRASDMTEEELESSYIY